MFLKSMNAAIGARDGCITNFPLKANPLRPLVGQKGMNYSSYDGFIPTAIPNPSRTPEFSGPPNFRGLYIERQSQNLWLFSAPNNLSPFIVEGTVAANGSGLLQFTDITPGGVKMNFSVPSEGLYTMTTVIFSSVPATDITSYLEGSEPILNFHGLAAVPGTRQVRRVATDIYVVSATFNYLASRSPSGFVGVQHNGAIPMNFSVYNTRVESGRYSGSGIPTNGAPATRNRTVATFSELLPRSGTMEIWTYTPRYYETSISGIKRVILEIPGLKLYWEPTGLSDPDQAGSGADSMRINTNAPFSFLLPKGALIQIALTWNDGGNIRPSVNGINYPVSTASFSTFGLPVDIFLGCNSLAEEQLNGEILSFKMFNYAKSAAQIAESYSQGL